MCSWEGWVSLRPVSNRRPFDYESNALPTELRRHYFGNFFLRSFLCSFWQDEQMKCFFDVSPSLVLIRVPLSLSRKVVVISSLQSSHFSMVL